MYGFEAELIGCWYSIILIECFGFDAEYVDVLFGDECLEDVVSSDILGDGCYCLIDIFDFGLEYFFEPLVLGREGETVKEFMFLGACDELAVD